MAGEIEATGGGHLAEIQGALDEEQSAERALVRSVLTGIAVAVPICIAIWIGLVVLAVGGDDPDWGIWIAMASIVGVFAGAFFGGLAGFVAKAHLLDEVDHHAAEVAQHH